MTTYRVSVTSNPMPYVAFRGGFSHRKLMTDTEEITLDFVRPQILNGIDALATRGDLLDRSYLIRLHKPDRRVDPSGYWAKFDQVHPQLLGALSQALAILPTVRIDDLPRMAEYAKLGTTLEPSLNLRQGAFMAMHQGIKLESHPVLDADGNVKLPALFLWR
jgi:hypothetical protein